MRSLVDVLVPPVVEHLLAIGTLVAQRPLPASAQGRVPTCHRFQSFDLGILEPIRGLNSGGQPDSPAGAPASRAPFGTSTHRINVQGKQVEEGSRSLPLAAKGAKVAAAGRVKLHVDVVVGLAGEALGADGALEGLLPCTIHPSLPSHQSRRCEGDVPV